MYILSNLTKAGYKALSGFIATTSLISMFGVMPVQAEETNNTGDLAATISGNTLGNNINSIRSTACEGEQQLSGTDAEVFKRLFRKVMEISFAPNLMDLEPKLLVQVMLKTIIGQPGT